MRLTKWWPRIDWHDKLCGACGWETDEDTRQTQQQEQEQQ